MAILKSTKLKLIHDGSAGAVRKYLEQTGAYYAQKGYDLEGSYTLPPAEWVASPAVSQLGLDAPGCTQDDQNKALAKVLAGFHPKTGKRLVQNAGAAKRIMAFDMTFSPRKEYSLAYAAASGEDRRKMTEAMHKARDKALALIAAGVNTRAGAQGSRHVDIDGLIVRAVDHIDSREGEPQWHCHAIVANVALDKEGKFRTLDPRALFRRSGSLQEAAQEVFARELARGMQALDLGIERRRVLDAHGRDTGKVANVIVGVDQETCDAFSTRRKQIKEGLKKAAEKGEKTNATDVARSSRKDKDLSAGEVIQEARLKMEALAELHPGRFHSTKAIKGRQSTELEKVKGPDDWFDDLHAMESYWNRSSLIAKMARELPLDSDVDVPLEADRLLAIWEEQGKILRLEDDPQLGHARWCSREHWFIEESVLPAAQARAADEKVRLIRADVAQAIAEHEAAMSKKLKTEVHLTDEQKASVFHVACDTGGLACIIGQAGTGKSASAGAYVRAFQAAGRRVIGTSTSQAATDNLKKEAQIEGKNTAELLHALDKGTLKLSANDVIVLDEAGMVGAKTFRRIQEHVDKAGGKLVAVGDPKQLQAIEAGSPFSQLCESFGAAEITKIQRQRNEAARTLAESFYNDKKTGADIVQEMLDKGMLTAVRHQIKALAKAYLADQRDVRDKLIVVNTHRDGEAVDAIVRQGLKASDVLRAGSAEVLSLGQGEHQRDLEVCIGERIRFQANARKDRKTQTREWNNNDIGTVIGMARPRGKRGWVLKIQLDDGRRVEVDTAKFPHIGYAYARTAHSAQGLGAASTYWLARGGMLDRNMGLVAMTRTKENFHAFAAPDEVPRLAAALDAWGQKETVKELARRKNAPTVAHTLGKPKPTALGEDQHPIDALIAEIKRQKTSEALDRVADIQRAGRDFGQAMERWKIIREIELGQVSSKLDNLDAEDSILKTFEGRAQWLDGKALLKLERERDSALREKKRLEARLAVLVPKTVEAKKQARKELSDWLEADYVGGLEGALRDKELRLEDPKVVSFMERAKDLRQITLDRQSLQMQLDEVQKTAPPEQVDDLQQVIKERAKKVADLHKIGDEIMANRANERRTVALGLDKSTPFDEIDWKTSKFPDRDRGSRVDPQAVAGPATNGRNPAPPSRRRPGMLPTQPRLPTVPKPPRPPGWDQDIGM